MIVNGKGECCSFEHSQVSSSMWNFLAAQAWNNKSDPIEKPGPEYPEYIDSFLQQQSDPIEKPGPEYPEYIDSFLQQKEKDYIIKC